MRQEAVMCGREAVKCGREAVKCGREAVMCGRGGREGKPYVRANSPD